MLLNVSLLDILLLCFDWLVENRYNLNTKVGFNITNLTFLFLFFDKIKLNLNNNNFFLNNFLTREKCFLSKSLTTEKFSQDQRLWRKGETLRKSKSSMNRKYPLAIVVNSCCHIFAVEICWQHICLFVLCWWWIKNGNKYYNDIQIE